MGRLQGCWVEPERESVVRGDERELDWNRKRELLTEKARKWTEGRLQEQGARRIDGK